MAAARQKEMNESMTDEAMTRRTRPEEDGAVCS
jgi:hypothetical protein